MRFVTPSVVRIPLHNGTDWIDVKKELTVGEEKRFRAAGLTRMSQDQDKGTAIDIDWARLAIARVEAYLVEWSAKKPDGKDRPVTRGNIEALAAEDFDEIDEAIQKHIAEMAESKKTKDGETKQTVTLPS